MGKTRRKCPCGSGLRYNRCCGERQQPLSADVKRSHFKYDHSKPEDQIVGHHLFGHVVEKVIMSGGMGRVFVLRNSEGNRHALKSLPRERYKDIRLKKRFENEAKVWLFIPPHPNVATARKYFTVQGRPYIAMDYYARGDLARYLEEHAGELTKQKPFGFALQICDAMVHAARFGLKYHGDLKPQNCLVSDDGNSVLLSDFGLAKAANYLGEDAASSRLSWRSPSFAAPEVIESREITLASDIFSFGVMLYWLLFLDIPERAADGTLNLHEHSEYQDALLLIERCCKLNPRDRISSFELLRRELEIVYSSITQERPRHRRKRGVGVMS